MEKIKKYIPFFSLKEMAFMGMVGDIEIQVYTDHAPIHFHAKREGKFEVRLTLPKVEVLSYKWKKGNSEISNNDIKEIKKWLKIPCLKNKKITNQERIELDWDSLNPGK